ncbi:MAG: hypothetical protein KF775_18880 [Cyclobacteriaceae bacterium]|nr:hypothetical protein [Cyclobacteriaceae bacterium]
MNLKYELYHIISGISKNSARDLIEAAAYYLRESKKAGRDVETIEFTKDQEAARLIEWIDKSKNWFSHVDESRFIARGAEQRVYLAEDTRYVIKLNDAVFYEFWLDYFYNLIIHNYLFPQTAYELKGFYVENNILHAVVKQAFIEITEPTDPMKVKDFLLGNGFQWKKNNDYYNTEAGIILEDLHDENVLTNKNTLFFIDTTFYLMPTFFKNE